MQQLCIAWRKMSASCHACPATGSIPACWCGLAPCPRCRAQPPSSPPSQPHPHPRSLEVPARPPMGHATGASHQGVPSGMVRGCRCVLVGKLCGGGRVGTDSVLQTHSLLCPPPLLTWKVALENGCFLLVKTLAGAQTRNDSFACMWCLLQQCCVGVLEVAGFGWKFSFPLFTFLLGKEKLLAGRLQVHSYSLLIRLPFFFSSC